MMIDCGMFQGPSEISNLNYDELQHDPASLEGVVLTHAHLDHCGRLPILTKRGFKGRIYMTQATKDILEIALIDSARIAEHDTDKEPMYDERDVYTLLSHAEIVKYHQDFTIGDFSIRMKDAGHILGSASLEVTDTQSDDDVKRLIFSGDLGNYPQDLIKKTEMIDEGDVVIMESTYGGRNHPNEVARDLIAEEISQVADSGGTLLIPCFSIQRTQEVLHQIKHIKQSGNGKVDIPVFLDSPMAIRVTDVYRKHKELFNEEFAKEAAGGDPFDIPKMRMLEKPQDSKSIQKVHGPKIIIAGSGMMSGGRIMKHALNYLPLGKTRLLIVGYQGEETLGREISEGTNPVEIFDKEVPVNAHVTQIHAMSAHADEQKLIQWLQHIQGTKKVFLIHGEDESRKALSEKIQSQNILNNVVTPQLNEELEV